MWRERYALVEDGRELVTIEGKGCGKRPVKVTLQDAAAAIVPGHRYSHHMMISEMRTA